MYSIFALVWALCRGLRTWCSLHHVHCIRVVKGNISWSRKCSCSSRSNSWIAKDKQLTGSHYITQPVPEREGAKLIKCEIGSDAFDALPGNYAVDYKCTRSQQPHLVSGMHLTSQTCYHFILTLHPISKLRCTLNWEWLGRLPDEEVHTFGSAAKCKIQNYKCWLLRYKATIWAAHY